MRRVLILGGSGKMGRALAQAFDENYAVTCVGSRDFDARDPRQVVKVIETQRPDIVINTVAFLGIDPCAQDPLKAFELNSAYPRQLAELSNRHGFLLVHFSTDSVFHDRDDGYFVETDLPRPQNVYGMTKLAGDWAVNDVAARHYVIRIAVLFGPHDRPNQFVEKMLQRVKDGADSLRIADDIVTSPCYSIDVAQALRTLVDDNQPYGLYHLVNQGRASLYELMTAIGEDLRLPIRIEPASHRDFPAIGRKNTCTPLGSTKHQPLRPWREAVNDYCHALNL